MSTHSSKSRPQGYSLLAKNGRTLRETTTLVHALKHACYASQLGLTVRIRYNPSAELVYRLAKIDKAHRERPRCKRDREYLAIAALRPIGAEE